MTIGVDNPAVRLRQAQNGRVTVSITAAPHEWVVSGIPVHVRNGHVNALVSPEHVSVRVRGPRDLMDTDAALYSASVDVAGSVRGRRLLPVGVETPPGIGLLRVDPAEVEVTIR